MSAQPPPGGCFAREVSLWRRFLWLGIKVLGASPASQCLAVAGPGFAAGSAGQCRSGRGEPRAGGGGRLGHPSAGVWGVGPLPSPLLLPLPGTPGSTEMGVKPCDHLWGGHGELGLLVKGAGGQRGSQASAVKGMWLFLAQRQRHRVQVLRGSQLAGAWLDAGPVWAMPASPQVIILLSPSCSISPRPGLSLGLHRSQVIS